MRNGRQERAAYVPYPDTWGEFEAPEAYCAAAHELLAAGRSRDPRVGRDLAVLTELGINGIYGHSQGLVEYALEGIKTGDHHASELYRAARLENAPVVIEALTGREKQLQKTNPESYLDFLCTLISLGDSPVENARFALRAAREISRCKRKEHEYQHLSRLRFQVQPILLAMEAAGYPQLIAGQLRAPDSGYSNLRSYLGPVEDAYDFMAGSRRGWRSLWSAHTARHLSEAILDQMRGVRHASTSETEAVCEIGMMALHGLAKSGDPKTQGAFLKGLDSYPPEPDMLWSWVAQASPAEWHRLLRSSALKTLGNEAYFEWTSKPDGIYGQLRHLVRLNEAVGAAALFQGLEEDYRDSMGAQIGEGQAQIHFGLANLALGTALEFYERRSGWESQGQLTALALDQRLRVQLGVFGDMVHQRAIEPSDAQWQELDSGGTIRYFLCEHMRACEQVKDPLRRLNLFMQVAESLYEYGLAEPGREARRFCGDRGCVDDSEEDWFDSPDDPCEQALKGIQAAMSDCELGGSPGYRPDAVLARLDRLQAEPTERLPLPQASK